MTTPIGGPFFQPSQQVSKTPSALNTWTVQLQYIEGLVQGGDKSGAMAKLNDLITQLNAHQPQTTKIRNALQELYGARSALQFGGPTSLIMNFLESAKQLLT